MKKVLQINSSILGEHSVSNELSDYTSELLLKAGGDRVLRDCNEIPHFDDQSLVAFSGQGSNISEAHKNVLDLSDKLIDELVEADVIVIGVPMYNFGIPSQLKSFFDFICRVGITFKYTEKGPIGLLPNKRVYILSSRGGTYHSIGQDFITPYLKQVLQFVGLHDLHFVYAEELNLENGANKDRIVEASKAKIDRLLTSSQPKQISVA